MFAKIKAELSKECSDMRHFNQSFFKDWLSYEKLCLDAELAESDDDADVSAVQAMWDKAHEFLRQTIFQSKFYIKNSSTYCVFLELAHQHRQEIKRSLMHA